jgi:tetratricopeptide (TPR) repeat protein
MRAAGTTVLGEMNDDFLMLRARLFHLQNRHDEAVETAEKLLARQQDNDNYLMIAGEYYYEAGRIEDAERVLRRAIEIDPTNAEAYNALGYFFAEAGIKLDEALELVTKALELSPNAGHIVDSLGWVHFMQGRYDEAVRDLERAVELLRSRPDPVVWTTSATPT